MTIPVTSVVTSVSRTEMARLGTVITETSPILFDMVVGKLPLHHQIVDTDWCKEKVSFSHGRQLARFMQK